jgi:anti-sigma regulatory factor (Ser/Thr protein kinase)
MAVTEPEWYPAKVLDTITEGVAAIRADGCYAFMNEAAKHILGTKETIVGRHYDDPLWELTTLDGTTVPVDEMPLAIVMRTGEPVLDAQYCATLPDGRQVVLAINAVPFRDEKQQLIGAAMSFGDITKRSRSEKYGWALSEMSTAVYSSLDFDTIVHRALNQGVDALGCDSGIIFMREEGSDWVMRYLCNLPGDMIGTRIPDKDASFTMLTGGAHGGAIAYNDAIHDERINNRLMRRFEIKSMLDVTLRVHGRDVADVSFVNHSKATPFTPEDVDFANKLGATVALALENVRLDQLYEAEHDAAVRLQEKDRVIRQAYSDVIDAVTGGRLVLLGPDEVDDVIVAETNGPYEITEPKELSPARATVAGILGDIDSLQGLLVAFSEGATNMLKHADGGIYKVGKTEKKVQLILSDKGPGIDFRQLPNSALVPGFSTTQTLGQGFTLMMAFTNRIFLCVSPEGTTLVLEKDL